MGEAASCASDFFHPNQDAFLNSETPISLIAFRQALKSLALVCSLSTLPSRLSDIVHMEPRTADFHNDFRKLSFRMERESVSETALSLPI